MSELKAYIAPTPDGTGLADYYLKSEADKMISEKDTKIIQLDALIENYNRISGETIDNANHHKYKRCLDNARWCTKLNHVYALSAYTHRGWKIARYYDEKAELYRKWLKRWLKIAEQFKEAK